MSYTHYLKVIKFRYLFNFILFLPEIIFNMKINARKFEEEKKRSRIYLIFCPVQVAFHY